MTNRKIWLPLIVSTGVSAVTQAQTGAPAEEPAVLEEIEVTASRISRSGFTAPTPMTTLGGEDRELREHDRRSPVERIVPSSLIERVELVPGAFGRALFVRYFEAPGMNHCRGGPATEAMRRPAVFHAVISVPRSSS
jgi:hypothetical protein